jgi:hypothetical protein
MVYTVVLGGWKTCPTHDHGDVHHRASREKYFEEHKGDRRVRSQEPLRSIKGAGGA